MGPERRCAALHPHAGDRLVRRDQRGRERGGGVLHPRLAVGDSRSARSAAAAAVATRQARACQAQQRDQQHQRGRGPACRLRRGDQVPGRRAGVRASDAGHRRADPDRRADRDRRHQADEGAGQHQQEERQQHPALGLRGRPRFGHPRLAQEDDAAHLGEAGQRQRADQRQPGDGEHLQPDRPVEHSPREERLVGHPLADEPVERREPDDRHRADEERRPGERHPLGEAAQPLDVAGAGRVDHRARAEEQQALEERVVQGVQRRAREAEHRDHRVVIGHPQRPRADAEQDDPDVLDAVVGEEPLEVVLRERPEHAEHARDHAEAQDGPSPPRPAPRPAAGARAAARRSRS